MKTIVADFEFSTFLLNVNTSSFVYRSCKFNFNNLLHEFNQIEIENELPMLNVCILVVKTDMFSLAQTGIPLSLLRVNGFLNSFITIT